MTGETSHVGIMHPDYYEALDYMNTTWERPHPGPFYWNDVQSSATASYDWSTIDSYVTTSQASAQNIIATIWPYADWDQSGTYSPLSDEETASFPDIGSYRHAPVDTDAYQAFVQAMVERYDGDGIDDMEGLTQAITTWEVANEPSLEEIIFFDGTAAEYYALLEATYTAIKAADSDAVVVNGGMAGADQTAQDYWTTVMELGGGQYIDVFSFHSIGQGMDLNLPTIQSFLSGLGVTADVWVTEIEFDASGFGESSITTTEYANLLTKTFTTAWANGVQKTFFVGTATGPGDENAKFMSFGDLEVDQSSSLPAYSASYLQDTATAIQTLTGELDFFTSATVESETRSGTTITDAVYSFTDGTKTAYVLWGTNATLPASLTGSVRQISVDGTSTVVDASSVTSSDTAVILANYQTTTGSDADDALTGWSNVDTMSGGAGADTLSGADGADLLYGNDDLDVLSGGSGSDTLFGGQNTGTDAGGDSTVAGQRDGTETLYGGDGGDLAYGNIGSDLILGGAGDDVLYGGQDADTLSGGAGNDSLFGNRGDDALVGGDGGDVFFVGAGSDTVSDFDVSSDRIGLSPLSSSSGSRSIADGTDGAVVTYDNGSSVTLLGVSSGSVTDSLFV